MTKTLNVKGVDLGKRLYLEGVVLDLQCPHCKSIVEHDFGRQHLEYFISGDTETLDYLYCDACGEETDYSGTDKYFAKVKVDLHVTIEGNLNGND